METEFGKQGKSRPQPLERLDFLVAGRVLYISKVHKARDYFGRATGGRVVPGALLHECLLLPITDVAVLFLKYLAHSSDDTCIGQRGIAVHYIAPYRTRTGKICDERMYVIVKLFACCILG